MEKKVLLLVLVLAGLAFGSYVFAQIYNTPTVDVFSSSELRTLAEGPPVMGAANVSVNYSNYIKDEHNNIWEWRNGAWYSLNTEEIKKRGINVSAIQREFPKCQRVDRKDTDGDYISDCAEIKIYGTDPLKLDTDGDGIDDFNELFTYPHLLNPNDQNDAKKFLEMIPNVKAKAWNMSTIGVVPGGFKQIVEIAKRDPLVQWYADHTEIKSEPETLTEEYRWSGKLIINGEPFCFGKHKEDIGGINGDISPSYFFTHGRRGACAHMSIATRTVFELKGYEGVFIGVPGHIATEISKDGQNFVINGVGIMKSEDFYETHPQNWTKYPKEN